jgi:predicted 3-demethylubiquinone-9 3-methyltransferase (glyoxalase superfamily)
MEVIKKFVDACSLGWQSRTIMTITPCLWFDSQAEEAAKFYTSIFKNSSIGAISRYGKEGQEFHGREPGTAMTVEFTLDGNKYTALNGGPIFKFTEAISFQVPCQDQAEIDYYWSKLTEGGEESQCGWLKDKFGLSWQVFPAILPTLLSDPEKAGRVTNAFMKMKKFDIQTLLNA